MHFNNHYDLAKKKKKRVVLILLPSLLHSDVSVFALHLCLSVQIIRVFLFKGSVMCAGIRANTLMLQAVSCKTEVPTTKLYIHQSN